MVTFIVGLLLGILAGVLIARNNIKKVNKIVAEAEEAAKTNDTKIHELQAKWKKHLGKD